MVSRRSLISLVAIALMTARLSAQTAAVTGRVLDPSDLPLPGVSLTLREQGELVRSTVSGTDGTFTIDGLSPGRYELDAELGGFEPLVRRDLEVDSASLTVNLEMSLAVVQQDVTVTAPVAPDVIGSTEPGAPVSVTRDVMNIAMLPNSQIDDVLPLMPNVVRGPDGLISIAGARSASMGLSVDGSDRRDPVLGGSGVMLPLEAVETMQVYAGGAPAELGNATGGLTSVVTRAGSDQFHMHADSFFPRLLYDNGLSGVAYWDPNVGLGGPLVRGRLTVQQSISYRYDRNSFTTLAGPDHNLFDALLSWTSVDARLSDAQHLRVSVGADPRATDRANITAFTPASVMPRVGLGGWTTGVSDALALRHVFLELRADALHTQLSVTPHGASDYVMRHDGVQGSYFDTQNRQATRTDAGARLTWSPNAAHMVTAGVSVAQSSLDQTIASHPIEQLRSDATLARAVAFLTTPPARVRATTASAFVQDHWSIRPWLVLDAGARADAASGVASPPVAPRLGWTMASADGRTSLRGGVGLYTETMPLAALAFSSLPARQVTDYDTSGASLSTELVSPASGPLDTLQATRWDLEADRRVGAWTLRLRYESRASRHELVVTPTPGGAPGVANEWLSSSGLSRARSVEGTAGYRGVSGSEWYVSYVRAVTSGPQNSLDATEGLLRTPFVQPLGNGPLTADVPHRMLAWGVVHLPAQFTVAPFLDVRSGFAYSAIDDQWNVVGAPNSQRLPAAASLDLSVTRVMGLPRRLPDARVGLKLYNVASLHTERDVQADVNRPDFGTTYDPVPRDFSIVFELLWGRHGR